MQDFAIEVRTKSMLREKRWAASMSLACSRRARSSRSTR